MVNETIYKQYDSRWGNEEYPDKYSRLSDSGCGCVSVLHCIIEREKYKKYTPKKIVKYMKQFAISGQGTLWSGITTALDHYEMEKIKIHDTMASLWKELAKGDRVGVIWFRKKGGSATGPDGTCWTSTGHYIAFTDYKVKGKKHYLYMKDSGQRQHSGWYCYETSMKGCVYEVCSCKVPAEPETKLEKKIKDMKKFAKKYADDNSYKYRKWSETNKYTHQCPLCHPKSNEHATKGWNCRGFVSAILYHGGGIKSIECSCKGMGLLGKKLKDYTLANWKKYNGEGWKRIVNLGKDGEYKNLKKSQLKDGDVIFYFNTDKTMKHTAFVYDAKNGKIADATSSGGIRIRKPATYGTVAFRYIGK